MHILTHVYVPMLDFDLSSVFTKILKWWLVTAVTQAADTAPDSSPPSLLAISHSMKNQTSKKTFLWTVMKRSKLRMLLHFHQNRNQRRSPNPLLPETWTQHATRSHLSLILQQHVLLHVPTIPAGPSNSPAHPLQRQFMNRLIDIILR